MWRCFHSQSVQKGDVVAVMVVVVMVVVVVVGVGWGGVHWEGDDQFC